MSAAIQCHQNGASVTTTAIWLERGCLKTITYNKIWALCLERGGKKHQRNLISTKRVNNSVFTTVKVSHVRTQHGLVWKQLFNLYSLL